MGKKKNIALIGMPAVGKSTVGILLAKKLGFGFIDTDISIQTGQRKTLAQIIAQKGLDALDRRQTGDYVVFRPYELAAALNRLRSLQVRSSSP